jgi:hypothetical protein
MATLDTIQTRIDQIDALLSGGVKSASSGDERVDYDLQALKDERDRLTRIVSGSSRSQYRRVVFKSG